MFDEDCEIRNSSRESKRGARKRCADRIGENDHPTVYRNAVGQY
jgi:hypothetical protein